MATSSHSPKRRVVSNALAFAALLVGAAVVSVSQSAGADHRLAWMKALDEDEVDLVGFSGHVADSTRPKITAGFPAESYAPGMTAALTIVDSAPHVTVQVFRAGTDFVRITENDVMSGRPVTAARPIGDVDGRRVVQIRLGSTWPSGVYFATLTAPGGRIGYAPFVLRPRRLGEHKVAIVIPTQTWEAYNFRDDDGNGVPDTWYVTGSTARLGRPFLNRGVPPHFRYYDLPFLRWAYLTHHDADYVSDAELNGASGEQLRKAYELLIFEGHHEYVTEHEYDAVTKYRDLGGNLMFLSANNFFWKITIADDVMTRVAQWRDLGRPESSLIGVQYFHNDRGEHRGPWIVRKSGESRWLTSGTGLGVGSRVSSGGIEADDVTAASPKGIEILAAIRNLYGDGQDADMTYYRTASGAQVFAAGAFTLAGSVWQGDVRRLMSNLWNHLAVD